MHTALFSKIPTALFVAFFLILGISWQAFNNPLLPALFIIMATPLALWNKKNLQLTAQRLLLAFATFCCGGLRYGWQEYNYSQAVQKICNKKISICGEVLKINREQSSKTRIIVAINTINAQKQPIMHVQLSCKHHVACKVGDIITLDDIIFTPPLEERYAQYLKKCDIVATGSFYEIQKLRINEQSAALSSQIEQKRLQLIDRLKNLLSPQTLSLVSQIFFGYKAEKTACNDLLREQFQWWGISHYLARSGLHLIMFIFIIQLLCAYIPAYMNIKRFIIAFCIVLYTLFSFTNISFARSLLMILLYAGCAWSRIPQHAIHIIATSCLAILLYNTQYLFALDFQLSFALTLALILLKP